MASVHAYILHFLNQSISIELIINVQNPDLIKRILKKYMLELNDLGVGMFYMCISSL